MGDDSTTTEWTYQYTYLSPRFMNSREDDVAPHMNDMAAQGWELVTASSPSHQHPEYHFFWRKRRS